MQKPSRDPNANGISGWWLNWGNIQKNSKSNWKFKVVGCNTSILAVRLILFEWLWNYQFSLELFALFDNIAINIIPIQISYQDELESLPFPNEETEFNLPDEIFESSRKSQAPNTSESPGASDAGKRSSEKYNSYIVT